MAWERDSLLHQLTLAHTHSYTCTAALPPSDDPRDEMAAGLVARMPQLAQNLPQTEVQSLPHSLPPSPPSSLLQLSVHSFSPSFFSSLLPSPPLLSLPSLPHSSLFSSFPSSFFPFLPHFFNLPFLPSSASAFVLHSLITRCHGCPSLKSRLPLAARLDLSTSLKLTRFLFTS